MKILYSSSRTAGRRGSAVIIVMTLLAIMSILVTVNVVAVNSLRREVRLIEKKQRERLTPNPPRKAEVPAKTPGRD